MSKLSSYLFPVLLVCGLGLAGYGISSTIQRALPEDVIRIERGDYSAVTRRYGAETVLFTSTTCGYCALMKDRLDARSVAYVEIQVDKRPADMDYLMKTLKVESVPTLIASDRRLSGFDEALVDRFIAQ
jgi:glutaredoxin 3